MYIHRVYCFILDNRVGGVLAVLAKEVDGRDGAFVTYARSLRNTVMYVLNDKEREALGVKIE